MSEPPVLALVLPEACARALAKAATTRIPKDHDPKRPSPRQIAIEKTTQQIKQQHPQFFHIKEIQNEDQTQ